METKSLRDKTQERRSGAETSVVIVCTKDNNELRRGLQGGA